MYNTWLVLSAFLSRTLPKPKPFWKRTLKWVVIQFKLFSWACESLKTWRADLRSTRRQVQRRSIYTSELSCDFFNFLWFLRQNKRYNDPLLLTTMKVFVKVCLSPLSQFDKSIAWRFFPVNWYPNIYRG